jgi:hypothetical protein
VHVFTYGDFRLKYVQIPGKRRCLGRVSKELEGLVAARSCRFKSCFPHWLRDKGLRQIAVSPFSFLGLKSVANRWQGGSRMAVEWIFFNLVVQ